MSSNRLSYDSCAYSKKLQQSTDPLEYNLFRGKFESCTQCAVGDFTNNLEFGIQYLDKRDQAEEYCKQYYNETYGGNK